MTNLIVHPQLSPLRGKLSVPGDKSISHRAVMLASITEGKSQIRNWLPAGDTLATLEIVQALGVEVGINRASKQAWQLDIEGRGLRGLKEPSTKLDCKNAGTCMRLMAGLLAGQSFESTLDGSEQLRKRPMRRIVEPLSLMGARIASSSWRAPLTFKPASLKGITYRLPVASAQVKSAILLAALYAAGPTSIHQPGPARDHTEKMLAGMGVRIEEDGQWIHLPRESTLSAAQDAGSNKMRSDSETPGTLQTLNMAVPGDISSAAFPLVAAAMVSGSQIVIEDAGVNNTRTGLLDALTQMGAHLEVRNKGLSGGEPTADILLSATKLNGCKIGGSEVVRTIDEIPVWAAAASRAEGRSILRDASELRVKEVDRLHLLAEELKKMGAHIDEHSDGLEIHGPVVLQGAQVDSHGDHRLAMALAVAGLAAESPTTVESADCINDSFPGFAKSMQTIGARLEWES